MLREIIENVDIPYNNWKTEKEKLEQGVEDAESKLLTLAGKNKGGLVPEEIRTSREYISANKIFKDAFNALREFNRTSPKVFLGRERSEYRNMRGY